MFSPIEKHNRLHSADSMCTKQTSSILFGKLYEVANAVRFGKDNADKALELLSGIYGLCVGFERKISVCSPDDEKRILDLKKSLIITGDFFISFRRDVEEVCRASKKVAYSLNKLTVKFLNVEEDLWKLLEKPKELSNQEAVESVKGVSP